MNAKRCLFVVLVLSVQLFYLGCATTPYLSGVAPDGRKVYLGPVPIQNIEAYQAFLHSSKSERAKLDYLLQRIKEAQGVEFYHGGERYNWTEAYEGARWIVEHHFEKGQNSHSFIKKEALFEQEPGKPNAVKFPDGSLHLDYYILANELDLLEETLKQN